jgi:hypothetical protein
LQAPAIGELLALILGLERLQFSLGQFCHGLALVARFDPKMIPTLIPTGSPAFDKSYRTILNNANTGKPIYKELQRHLRGL